MQMVGYHSLEDAYHRLLERGEIDLPRHNFESFDLKPGEDVKFEDMNSEHFKYGTDKYDISAKLHDQQYNPVVAPKIESPAPETTPVPETSPVPEK